MLINERQQLNSERQESTINERLSNTTCAACSLLLVSKVKSGIKQDGDLKARSKRGQQEH